MDHPLTIARDRRLVAWLATLGYDVESRPETADDVFVREARQWGLGPAELAGLVRELYRTDEASAPVSC